MRISLVVLTLAFASALAADPDIPWIDKEAARLCAADTDAWRRIPWATSLTAAATAGKTERRLLFVFTHDGNIDTGRC